MFRVTLKLEFAMTDTEILQEDLAAGAVPMVQELLASITDWVVVQKTTEGEVHWIIETKGRVWEGTEAKDTAIRDWCQRITEQTGRRWEFARVNQATFQASNPKTLAEAVRPAGLRGVS